MYVCVCVLISVCVDECMCVLMSVCMCVLMSVCVDECVFTMVFTVVDCLFTRVK